MSFSEFGGGSYGGQGRGQGQGQATSSSGVGDFDFFGGGGGGGSAQARSEAEEWYELQKQVFDGTKGLASHVPQATPLIRKLGTVEDSDDLRGRIRGLMKQCDNDVVNVTDSMRQMNEMLNKTANPADLEERKLIVAKLTRDFQDWLVKYKQMSQSLKAKERQGHSILPPQNSSRNEWGQAQANDERQALLAKQLTSVDNELDLHELLVEEREEQIRGIESKIVEVNDIFRDLGVIVDEQQDMVDHIELQIERAKDDTTIGVQELTKAKSHQKSAGGKLKCIALLCVFMMVAIVIAVIVAVVLLGN